MNQTFKKISAIAVASMLSVTAVPVSISAQSFTEIEKAALAETISDFAAQYAQSFQEYESLQSGIREDMTLTLDEAGRSLLGFLVPTDLSWFHDLRLSADFSVEENAQYMTAGVYLNDTKICTLEYFFDLENLEIYMRIPELRDGYVKVDYEEALKQQKAALEQQREALENSENTMDEATEEALEAMEDNLLSDPEYLQKYMSMISNLPEYLPEPEIAEELLTRYSDIIFDSIKAGEIVEKSYDYNGSSVPLTAYQGILDQKDVQQMMKTLIETAKKDSQLKDILSKLDQGLKGEESIYERFIDTLEDAEQDLDADLADENAYILASVSVDQNGKAVERSLSLHDNEEITPVYEWEKYTDENLVYSSLTFGGFEDGFNLYGHGTMDGELLSGDYVLTVAGEELLNIQVTDYNTSSMKEGEWIGNYRLSLPESAATDNPEEVNPLQNFSLLFDVASDKDTGKIDLSVESSGTSLATLSLEANLGVTVEKPDFKDLAEVYDSMDEAAMNEYTEGISVDAVLGNLAEAGMPEELIVQFFSGSTSEESLPEAELPDTTGLSEEDL